MSVIVKNKFYSFILLCLFVLEAKAEVDRTMLDVPKEMLSTKLEIAELLRLKLKEYEKTVSEQVDAIKEELLLKNKEVSSDIKEEESYETYSVEKFSENNYNNDLLEESKNVISNKVKQYDILNRVILLKKIFLSSMILINNNNQLLYHMNLKCKKKEHMINL